MIYLSLLFFFFNDTATTEIYTLSLHDALPIYVDRVAIGAQALEGLPHKRTESAIVGANDGDRKSTRLNSSHSQISYAVFCLKKKKRNNGVASDYDIRQTDQEMFELLSCELSS